ncbi:hypothetical protein Pan241w_09860 [Gimesia alba]|uniref:Uncharacterized protein n=1 Tax=Gimesia alba TaxID=2527973 RepID=A0A517RAL0_9PLAN|nr:hypothetical protein [Gimesia alba]QDT40927.1 hypothetical protein Pan241w_09860 [Gimesia alba]
MFQSKPLIYLCILIGTGLGWWYALHMSSEKIVTLPGRMVLHQGVVAQFHILYYSGAVLGAIVGSWKQQTSFCLALTGMTMGLIVFSILGPLETTIESHRFQLTSYHLVMHRTIQNTIGMLLGAFLFLFWPEIGGFLNRISGTLQADDTPAQNL